MYQPERDGEEETEAEPEADLVMKMDPETLGDGVLDRDEDDDMDTWGEFENALLGVSRGVLEPVMEVDDDEEMDGDTVPVTLSEPVEELVWEGDSLLVTMDDEVTEIVATGEVVESELQVAVLVRVKVGEFEQVLAGVMLFDEELEVVMVHEFELEGEQVSMPERVRVVLSDRLEEAVIDIVRDAVRDGMPLGLPVTLCESLL